MIANLAQNVKEHTPAFCEEQITEVKDNTLKQMLQKCEVGPDSYRHIKVMVF